MQGGVRMTLTSRAIRARGGHVLLAEVAAAQVRRLVRVVGVLPRGVILMQRMLFLD